MTQDYVHGYSEIEHDRLMDQANTLTDLLHHDTCYTKDELVLEAGCGVGAQTITLAGRNQQTNFVSVDISEESLKAAETRIKSAGLNNVTFKQADIFNLPFDENAFDHIFICFVLEHLSNPLDAINRLKKVLKPGGTITCIEGDHGSAYYYPENEKAGRCIDCLVQLQHEAGGNALIGRSLYPLLSQSQLQQISVSPRLVYVDDSKPALVEGFTKKTFTAMVEGVKETALEKGMMSEQDWNEGIQALYQTAQGNGTFCYTFFKGVGTK